MSNLAGVHRKAGRYTEALQLYYKALAIDRQYFDVPHLRLAKGYANLGSTLVASGQDSSDASTCLNNAVQILAAFPNQKLLMVNALDDLALNYRRNGRYSEALTTLQRASRLLEQLHGKDNPRLSRMFHTIGFLYSSCGQYQSAVGFYQRALDIDTSLVGKEHPAVATGLHDLAATSYALGQTDEAIGLFKQAIAALESLYGKDDATVATAWHNMGLAQRSKGDGEAWQSLSEALRIRLGLLGPDHPDTAASQRAVDSLPSG